MNNKEKIAIVPGSFDPITNGHLAIIKKTAVSYDTVYVAVMINAQKRYMFSLEERKEIAEAAVSGIDNVKVISSQGWLWELARNLNATAIVKGYRNEADLEYEREMATFNEKHYPKGKTVLIKSENSLSTISSTVVRDCIKNEKSIANLLPQTAIDKIKEIYTRHNSPNGN